MRRKPAIRIVFAPLARRGAIKGDLRHLHGQAQGRTIWLDPRLPDVGATLLHELLHVRHPGWPEEKVVAEETLRWQRMGWRQKARLYQMLGGAILEGEQPQG